jgi:signal transduction histidine kinase
VAAPRNVVLGLYVLLLLIVFERLARVARLYAAQFFATDRQRARQKLIRFQEQMRNFIDQETLVQRTVEVVGETLEARSAILFLCPLGPTGPWLSSTYHPSPPYLTQRMVKSIWPHMEAEGRIWARNPELSESILPFELSRLLLDRGAALAVPVMGQAKPIGLLVLGQKKTRRAVYNLEDLDLLRSVSGQLALAIERLILVEREKMLARQHAEAQLVALRAQINPHFLFNALNTIIALIEERPEDAETTVEHLAAIFRHILQTGGLAFVPLEDELTLVNHYLGIEQARFGAKLAVKQHLDPTVRLHPVPAFAIQTLVENAVKHGLEPQRGGGVLEIDCRAVDTGGAEVVVRDTGVGIPSLLHDGHGPDAAPSLYGIGLNNVASRLEQLYGRAGLLRIESNAGTGTAAYIHLPQAPEHGLLTLGRVDQSTTGEFYSTDA